MDNPKTLRALDTEIRLLLAEGRAMLRLIESRLNAGEPQAVPASLEGLAARLASILGEQRTMLGLSQLAAALPIQVSIQNPNGFPVNVSASVAGILSRRRWCVEEDCDQDPLPFGDRCPAHQTQENNERIAREARAGGLVAAVCLHEGCDRDTTAGTLYCPAHLPAYEAR